MLRGTTACSDRAVHPSLQKRGKIVPLVYQGCKKQEDLAQFTRAATSSAMAFEQLRKDVVIKPCVLWTARFAIFDAGKQTIINKEQEKIDVCFNTS